MKKWFYPSILNIMIVLGLIFFFTIAWRNSHQNTPDVPKTYHVLSTQGDDILIYFIGSEIKSGEEVEGMYIQLTDQRHEQINQAFKNFLEQQEYIRNHLDIVYK